MGNTQNCGIYCWTNKHNGKKYIGQSINLNNRKHDFSNFNYDYGGSLINRARAKYNSSEYWNYEILEYCDIDELDEKEIFYISQYDTTNREIGYNIAEGGKGANKIPIFKICIESGKILESYNSINEAADSDCRAASICECCKHRMSYYKNFIWVYQSEYSEELIADIQEKIKLVKSHYVSNEARKKMSERNRGEKNGNYGRKHSDETKKIISQKAKGRKQSELAKQMKRKTVLQYSLDGDFLKEWDSPLTAEKYYNGKKTGMIYKNCIGKKKSAFGFIWRYKNDVA